MTSLQVPQGLHALCSPSSLSAPGLAGIFFDGFPLQNTPRKAMPSFIL